MYKFKSKQLSIMDFNMPLGMKLNPNNRWVKIARVVPWDSLEKLYAAIFKDKKSGSVALQFRLMLGAMIIKLVLGASDEETRLHIQETPGMQYLCGFSEFNEVSPFNACSLTRFRKRLTPDLAIAINEIAMSSLYEKEIIKDSKLSDSESDTNTDTAINTATDTDTDVEPTDIILIDATVSPQEISFPTDLALLNKSREKLEKMIDKLHIKSDGDKPRTYRKVARKEYLKVVKKKKKTKKEIRKAVGKQLRYVARDIKIIMKYFDNGRGLPLKQIRTFQTILKLFEQQEYMYKNKTTRVPNRIVSIHQPHIRPILRGKPRAECEFGAKIDISVSNGLARLEYASFDSYNEGNNLINITERYFERNKRYPKSILADKQYRNRENLKYCNERNIKLLGVPLGRPKKDQVLDKKTLRQSEIDRIEIERKISLLKRKYGLGLIKNRLATTSLTTIALSMFVMNVVYASRLLFICLYNLIHSKLNLSHFKRFVSKIYPYTSLIDLRVIWKLREMLLVQ